MPTDDTLDADTIVYKINPAEALEMASGSDNDAARLVAAMHEAMMMTVQSVIDELPAEEAVKELRDMMTYLNTADERTLN